MEGHDVGSEIQGMINSLERDNPDLSAVARVKKAWEVSVDKRVREHVTGIFVVPNTEASEVVVYVDSSIRAADLNVQVELFRLNLNIELGKERFGTRSPQNAEQIKSLKFVVSKKAYISKQLRTSTRQQLEEEEQRYRNVQPVALNDDEISGLQEAASLMENEKLRDVVYNAAKANLEWQKGLEKIGA